MSFQGVAASSWKAQCRVLDDVGNALQGKSTGPTPKPLGAGAYEAHLLAFYIIPKASRLVPSKP